MYRCEISGKVSRPNEKAYKLVTKTRVKEYFNKEGQKIGQGWEIVEEKTVSRDVYNKHTKGLTNGKQ